MKSRNVGIDVARIMACFAVLCLHLIGRDAGQICGIIYYLSGFAIPVFFMASGYFVLNKKEITMQYVLSKFKKIVPVVFAWVFIMWVSLLAGKGELYNPLMDFALSIIQKGNCAMLWFFWALLATYALSPLIHRMIDGKFSRHIAVVSVLALLCVAIDICSQVSLFSGGESVQKAIPQTFRLWTWLFYFAVGGLLANSRVVVLIKEHQSIPVVALIAGMSATVFWCYSVGYLQFDNHLAEYYYDSPVIMLYSIALFCVCNAIGPRIRESLHSGIIEVAACTMGIYITHMFVVRFISHWYGFTIVPVNLLIPPCVFCLCLLITLLMRKNTYSNYLVSV